MAHRVWRDAEELLRYLAANYPFDIDGSFEPKLISVDSVLPGGDTPLHMVAAWGDVRGIELLLDAGAKVNALGEMSYTPLATAVSAKSVEAVRALLLRGASAHMKTEFGMTPYELAMRDGSGEMKEAIRVGSI